MKYLKRFSTEAAYNEYINSGSTVYLPNVSLIDNGTVSKFNDSKWNQLIRNGNFAEGAEGWSRTNCTVSVSNGIITLTPSSTGPTMIYTSISGIEPEHKLFISLYMQGNGGDLTGSRYFGYLSSPTQWLGSVDVTTIGTRRRVTNIITTTSTATLARVGLYYGSTYNTGVVQLSNIMLIDLTSIYGKGNEPATPADFIAHYPNDYYPYKPL